jgi:hypothetical protein
MDILDYWRNHCNILVVSFKANINDILFDENHRLNNKQKLFHIYRHVIYYLCKRVFANWIEYDNPIIRLKDKLSVPASKIVSLRKIKL